MFHPVGFVLHLLSPLFPSTVRKGCIHVLGGKENPDLLHGKVELSSS